MTLTVHDISYDVVLNGTDYVTQEEPLAENFEGTFTATVDGKEYENMALAGLPLLEDGWHICLYQRSYQELLNIRTESVLNALLGGA